VIIGGRPPDAARLLLRGRTAVASVVLVAVVLVTVALAGCASGGGAGGPSRREDRDARNRTESDTVNRSLGRLPGVLRVDGGYRRDASNAHGAVVLSITVRPGTDLAHVADQAIRAVWRSRLDPVSSMTVTVGSEDKPAAAIDRHTDFLFDRGQLTTSYGPRRAPPT
jgi:hypothetical protein